MSEAANWRWREFATPRDLAEVLADAVADRLREAIDKRLQAVLVVSGGTTPVQFFEALSRAEIKWSCVAVTLADERFVPPSSRRSNERIVRDHLIKNQAAATQFVGLYRPAKSVEDAAARAAHEIISLPFPPDVVVLGMGLDGHTASFFPDAENLGLLLDPSAEAAVMPVHAASAAEPRLTLSLARLVESGFIALHIEGKAKRDLLAEILRDPASGAPVEAVFRHSRSPVEIFWAPNEDEIP